MKWKKETNETDTKKLKQMNSSVEENNNNNMTNATSTVTSLNTPASYMLGGATS